MTTQDLQDQLHDLVNELIGIQADADENEDLRDLASLLGNLTRVETFQAADLLTRDKGLVLTTPNGDEFQLTIVRSRRGSADNE